MGLVVMQFAALAVLALGLARGTPGVLGGVLLAAGGLLGLWAIAANRPGNFNVRPVPKPGAALITSGPYRFVRHPMYGALLLAGAGCVAASPSLGMAGAWLLLAIVLLAKAGAEERALSGDARYRDYATRTARFVPFLF